MPFIIPVEPSATLISFLSCQFKSNCSTKHAKFRTESRPRTITKDPRYPLESPLQYFSSSLSFDLGRIQNPRREFRQIQPREKQTQLEVETNTKKCRQSSTWKLLSHRGHRRISFGFRFNLLLRKELKNCAIVRRLFGEEKEEMKTRRG
jgi:hypothetical protein